MSISRLPKILLALVLTVSGVITASAIEPGVEHYPLTHAPVPQQPAGPPQPGPAQHGGVPNEQGPPSGIEAGGPIFAEVEDVNFFKQPDLSTYGAGQPPNTGWFFSYDYLRWAVSVPKKTLIGNPDVVTNYFTGTNTFYGESALTGSNASLQLGTVDTSFLNNGPSNGYRWEGGYCDGERGFLLSAFRLYDNDQLLNFPHVHVPFFAPPMGPAGISMLQGFVDPSGLGFDADLNGNGIFGRYGATPVAGQRSPGAPDFGDLATLPVQFDNITVLNHRQVWGAEANYMWRVRPWMHGWVWDILAGPRYFKFDEEFFVGASGGVLADSFWDTRVINNLVGGQIGTRVSHRSGRLTIAFEGRFLAAANLEQIKQQTLIGSFATPGATATARGESLNLAPTGTNIGIRKTEWAPLGELRLNLNYQLFNKVSLNFGWTGIGADGIGRPSNMINYQLPSMGVLTNNTRQSLFVQGITAGVIFNR